MSRGRGSGIDSAMLKAPRALNAFVTCSDSSLIRTCAPVSLDSQSDGTNGVRRTQGAMRFRAANTSCIVIVIDFLREELALLGFRRPQFDLARKTAGRVRDQIGDDLRDIFRQQFPVGAGAFVAAETGLDGPGHDDGDADVVVAGFQHQRLGEGIEARLRGAVGGAAGERVAAGEAADVDDPAAAAALQMWNRGAAAEKDTGQVRFDDAVPALG